MEIDVEELLALPAAERFKLAQLLWESLPSNADLATVPLTPEQQEELKRRLDEYPEDDDPGRPVDEVMADLRRTLWPGA